MSKSTAIQVLDPVTVIDKDNAKDVKISVSVILKAINSGEKQLSTDFVKLGNLLLQVRDKKYWHEWGFPTFNEYISSIKSEVGKGRTQLYHLISISEKLLPHLKNEKLLENMGVSKALVLKQSVDKTGKKPSPAMIEAAQDENVDVQELKAIVFQNDNGIPQNEQGTYFDLGGFYVTKDEKSELVRAIEVAKKVDPVIVNTLPEWVQRKEVFLRMAREFLATYEALVEKGLG